RLVHFFERAGFFADGDSEGIQTDRATVEFVNQRFDDALVPLIKPIAIDLEHGERPISNFAIDAAVGSHLGVIAHPAQKIVRGAWRTPAASSDFGRAG